MSSTPIVQHMIDDLNAVIAKYSDIDITNVEAIGALEMVKMDLFSKMRDDVDTPIDRWIVGDDDETNDEEKS